MLTQEIDRISTTIIAPTPLVAANFTLLGRIIALLGPQYSRLSARWCECLSFSFGLFIALTAACRHEDIFDLRTLTCGCVCVCVREAYWFWQDIIALVVQALGGVFASSKNVNTGKLVRMRRIAAW